MNWNYKRAYKSIWRKTQSLLESLNIKLCNIILFHSAFVPNIYIDTEIYLKIQLLPKNIECCDNNPFWFPTHTRWIIGHVQVVQNHHLSSCHLPPTIGNNGSNDTIKKAYLTNNPHIVFSRWARYWKFISFHICKEIWRLSSSEWNYT